MSSSSSSFVSQHKYDVFLSFRGKDTRNNFIDHLSAALKRRGIVTFMDDRNLEAGEEIAPELLKAIQESWCSVIVFSKTYANSSWCLEELAAIFQQKKEREHKIFPIFYHVDPFDLRYQKSNVKEAFAKHEERYKENKYKIQKWRDALTEVAKISGWHLVNKPELEFIESIVQKIYSDVPRDIIRSFFSSKDFMPSNSSTLTFNQIINALNTNSVNMIGLYGMPGVGKTTLAKEVLKHVKEQKIFDNVVMVTMSQTPDINKIQNRIAESLRLKFESTTEEGKAEELWWRLKDVNKILIIIDDVWKDFEFETIGIPFGHEGCRILLTMRLKKVCDQMNCEEKFQLNILSEDEAWALFKVKANLKDVSLTLNGVAKEVASECKGLPLAVVAVGKALKGESLDGWIAANKRFKESRHSDNEDVCEEVYRSLQFSYDYLKGHNIRSCFLLCSLFQEDRVIDVEWLTMLAIGQELFSDIYSLNDLRREIHQALRKLLDCGLLLKNDVDADSDSDDNEQLKLIMHDVVRDFAHWITSMGENKFMVKEELRDWPSKSFECYTAISIWNSKISNFPEKLNFSKLKIFLFEGKQYSSRIPSSFFEGMKALQVLYLRNVIFSLESCKFIRNLRILWFRGCKLDQNILSLRNVKKLEILALLDTNIYELPAEEELVAVLRGLKSLYFDRPVMTKIIFPPNLLSSLMSLQELHVLSRNNVNLMDLNSLPRLTALSLLGVSTFPANFVFPKLRRYYISISEYVEFYDHDDSSCRTLEIDYCASSLRAFEELFCNVKTLILKNMGEHKNIVPCVDQEGLNEVTYLMLRSSKDLECLIDTAGEKGTTTIFSNLVKLDMMYMSCLKELCHGPTPIRFLQKLKHVSIGHCEELKVVFQMDRVFEEDEISHSTLLLSNLVSLELRDLPKLESIWKLYPTHQYHVSLRSLKFVTISDRCHKLKSIFSTCVAKSLLHLQRLTIYECNGIEQVFNFPQKEGEHDEENQTLPLSNLNCLELRSLPKLKWLWKGPTHLFNLRSLKTMTIQYCDKLAYLFSTALAQSLVNLEELVVGHCNSLEHVIIKEATENEDQIVLKVERRQQNIVLQRLQILDLENLENLSSFCPENFVMSLSLKEFKVRNCPRLTRFGNQQGVALQVEFKNVPLYDSKGLLCNAKKLTMERVMYHKNLIPNVQPEGLNGITFLRLEHGKGLEYLIDTTDQGHVSTSDFFNLMKLEIKEMIGLKKLYKGRFPKGFMQNLERLEVKNCMEMLSLSLALQNLKSVKIMNCGQLQAAFETKELLQDMEENKSPLLSNLTTLILWSLPELKRILKGPCHYVSLQRLKLVKIIWCNRLKYLFSPPLAQSLVVLEELFIANCDGLEHIITTGMEVDHAIAVPRLQRLQPKNLINLSCFCQENCPIVSPSLGNLTIEACPRLENLAIQQVNQEVQLKKLRLSELENDIICNPNNCRKIFQIEVEHFLSRTEVIKLENINMLQGPIQVASLQYLRELVVTNCNRLKSLFSSMLARNMSQLEILQIKSCQELEEIIEMNHTSKASSSQGQDLQPICFPSLEYILIDGCSNLKSLFPISVIPSLSNLYRLRIQGASKLEQVFGCQGEWNVEQCPKEIVFPKLWGFNLSKLPSVKSLAPMGYHFRYPSLDYFNVIECPMLTTSSSKDPKTPVHAITKAHQQVLNNTTECFTTMKETVEDQSACNDITWSDECPKPLYVSLGETKIIIREKA